MTLRQMTSNLMGVAFVVLGLLGNVGCSGEAPLPSPDSISASQGATDQGAADEPQVVAEYLGEYKNGHATLTPLTDPGEGAPAVTLQNFGKTWNASKYITLSTDPTDGTGVLGCTSTQYCADINMLNGTAVEMDNSFIEVTDYFGINPPGTPISWAGGAFPLSTAYSSVFVHPSAVEAANYGTIASMATTKVRWKFNVGNATIFNWHLKVYASFPRSTVTSGIYHGAAAAPAIDACTGTGVQKFFVSGDDGETQVLLPFAYTILTKTYDRASVGANGYVQFYSTGDGTPAVLSPTNSSIFGVQPVGLYPFWDDLGYDSTGGVCVSTSGTAPNRIWSVTWKNAMISTNQPAKPGVFTSANMVTYSLSIAETTDFTRFYYAKPTTITALTRGGSAACGWHGPNPPQKIGVTCGNNSAPWLPTDPTQYPQTDFYLGYALNPF